MKSAVEKLTDYHKSAKQKNGIEYHAQPPPVEPTPEPENPTVKGLNQAAQAYFELSRIYKERKRIL